MNSLPSSFRSLTTAAIFLFFVTTASWAGIGVTDLSISKTDGATTSVIGGSVTYTIVGTNLGPDDIFAATVTDTFPAILTCTWTCVASSGSSCTGAGSGNISDSVVLLENGTVTYTAICNISGAASPGTLDNTASISSPATDGDMTNNMATDSNLLVPTADLSITKTDGVTTAAPGASVTYTIVASNAGPMASFATSVVDSFPTGLSCTWTCSASVGSSCSAAGTGDINDPVDLLSGGTATYTATCAIPLTATGTLSNTAMIGGSVSDSTPGNNSATDADTVLVPSTDLSITKADSVDPVTAGESLTYTMTVTNNGPSNSTGATVSDVLPAGTTFSSSSDCTESGGTVTCAISALAPSASDSVSFTVTVDSDQTAALSNTATVAANETDPVAGNNSATEGTSVGTSTDLSITKADSVDPVNAGDPLTYTLTVTNNGPSDSSGSTVSDVLPAGTTFASSSDCTESGGTVTCAIGPLAAAANDSVSFSVTVDSDRTAALSNTATVAANETDPVAGNNSATEGTSVGASTDLSISKADSVDPATAGDPLTYTLTVTNNGPSDSTGSTVSDVLPAGTTFSSSGDCTESGGTVTCAIGALTSGASDMVSFTVTVDSDQTSALSNTATVAANETDPVSGNDSDTEATSLGTETDLSITKADSVDPVNAGESLTYTLTVTNNGPSDSSGSTVSDVLPAGTTFASSSDCTESGGTVTCAIGVLAVSANESVSFTVNVDSDQTSALSNTATVAANETDPVSGNDSATEGTSVGFSTDLSIIKADSVDPVTAGDPLTYSLTVTNNGPSDSTGSTVSDVLPSGTTFASSSDCTESAGTVTCAIGALAVGANESVSFTVNVDRAQTAALSNTATVAANETDPAAGNNSATEGTGVGTSTDLSIAKADSVDPVAAGESLTYTLTVTNNGPSASTGSTVSDVLPSGTTFASSSDCTESGGTVTCAVGALAVGASEGVSFTVDVDRAQTAALSNTATVAANESDPNAANDSATEGTAVAVPTDLSIAKVDSVDPVTAGETLTYTLTVTNDGPATSTGSTVTDDLPSGTTFASSGDCTEALGTVTCAIGSLAPGASEMVSFTVTVDPGQTTTLSNTATVAANEMDPNAANDSATEGTTVEVSTDLSITKVDSVDPVTAGESLTYTLTVTNNGPSDSTGSTVSDVLPAGTTFDSSSDCTESGGTVTCAIGGLAVGANDAVSFTVLVDSDQTAALSNTATVAADETDPNAANDSATEGTSVAAEADLSILKVDSADPLEPGTPYSYTITVSNAGPSDAVGVVVTDTLPAGVTFVSTTGCAEDPNGVPTCTLGDLAAGASVSYQIDVTAPGSDGAITNTATVSATTSDPNTVDNTDTEGTTVATEPLEADLSITKDDSVDTAVPGSFVTYEIVASNAGPDGVTSVLVGDMFPPELDCVWVCTPSTGANCTPEGTGDIADSVDLPIGGSVVFLADCAIDSAATGTLANTATISTAIFDPNPGNETATDTDTLDPSADLSVLALITPDTVEFGDLVTIEVTVRNDGPSDATGVFVDSILPSGLTFDSTVGCAEDPSGVPTCSLGTVPAGSETLFFILAEATAEGESSGTLTVGSDTADPNGGNDSALPTVSIGTLIEIPTLDTVGLGLLGLLLSMAGFRVLRRGRRFRV